MKVIIIKKKFLLATLVCLLILASILFFLIKPKNIQETFLPLDPNKVSVIDLTGDGSDDSLKVISEKDSYDIEIQSKGRTFLLSSTCNDSLLLSTEKSWPIKIYIKELSRNTTPEIIVQGIKNKQPTSYIFTWKDGEFQKLFESNKNILGILDYNSGRTPQIFSIDSSKGLSSLDAFMIVNSDNINITKDAKQIPNLGHILSFIDLIQTSYELDFLPNIFKEDISQDELALLWSLDKEHNIYSFQDAFFYDESINDKGAVTSLRWRLTFEKYNNLNENRDKEEVVFNVLMEQIEDNSFKISSFSREY